MRKKLSGILCLFFAALLLCAFSANAAAAEIVSAGTCGGNVTYTLDENGLLTISGAGAMRDYVYYDESPFCNKRDIKTVVIAEGVTSIGDEAFYGCTGLTSVTIPDSVTSIGGGAFYGCTGLTSVTIPNSVTSIGNGAFRDCTGLTSVTIGNGVTSIGNYAFCNCTGLLSVTIGNGVTSIGGSAFYNCTGLTSVTIPESVTSIGDWAFSACTRLTSVTIPNSVTSIGNYAFYECTGLTSVTIPESVTSIGEGAFSGCGKLIVLCYKGSAAQTYCESNSIDYGLIDGSEEENTFSGSVGILKWSINRLTCVLQLEGNGNMPPFSSSSAPWRQYKNYVHSVVIHPGLQKISDSAFSGCSAMFEITIPESVTSIGYGAFSGCRGLTSITIPGSVTSIGNNTFYNCTGLTSVTIPDSVTSIGGGAFEGCTGLTSITIPESVTSIGDGALYGCTGLLSVTIPESVTSIGWGAFYGCTGLTSITIPGSVTSIGEEAFSGCTGLTSVTIPGSITSIGERVFSGCTGLTSITIPNSVTFIGDAAFSGCGSLTEMVLPFSVKTIGSSAFSYCTALQKLYIYNKTCSIASAAIPATATICGFAGSAAQTYADANGYLFEPISHTEHAWNAGVITAAATCGANGVKTYTCTLCGENKPETVPATGNHTPGAAKKENVVAATCAKAGGFDEVVYCTVCSAELSREAKVTEKLAHTPVKVAGSAATCTAAGLTDGVKCAVCGTVLTAQTQIPALGHDMIVHQGAQATCTLAGNLPYCECRRCGNYYIDDLGENLIADKNEVILAKTAHTYANKVTKKATLTANGTLTPTCTVCGAKKSATTIRMASKVSISKAKFVYNGKIQKPTLTVKNSAGKAIASKYYTVKWSNASSKAVGKYTVTVTFKGNYSGTKTLTYTIVPKAVTGVKRAASTTKSVKLSWTKATGAKYYEVYGSVDGKTFKKITTVSTNTFNATKVNGKALAAGKTYWFKVRALDGTKKLIGAYSAVLKTGTLTAAPKITKLTSPKSKTATATWGKVTGAKSYAVYKSTDGKKWTKAGSTTGTSFTLTKLTGGKRIYVKVLAVNAYNANSAYSAVKYVTVKK